MSELVIEHGESRTARRLRRNRTKVALVVAALEGVAVLAGAVPWWLVVLVALGSLAAWAGFARFHASRTVRDVTWVVAVSQLLVVLVPIAAGIVLALAVVVLVVLVGVALAALFLDRR
ncbi:MAG TPA: hypothetical protein VH572_07725 [Gaiella sp.]|jgi:hypothetical protein